MPTAKAAHLVGELQPSSLTGPCERGHHPAQSPKFHHPLRASCLWIPSCGPSSTMVRPGILFEPKKCCQSRTLLASKYGRLLTQGCVRAPASESKTADSTTSLAQMVQDRLMCSESNREGEEWRDRLQPLGEGHCMNSTLPPWLAGNACKYNRCMCRGHHEASNTGHLGAGVGPSSARPSIDQRRVSNESARSGGAESGSTRSRRSSFALERASFDANRSSLEAFGLSNGRRPSVELAQVCTATPRMVFLVICVDSDAATLFYLFHSCLFEPHGLRCILAALRK